MRRDAPQPDETPTVIPTTLREDLESALFERHGEHLVDGEHIRIDGRVGPRAARVQATVGDARRGVVYEAFVREVDGELLDGALGLVVDYLDGVLEEVFAGQREGLFPLDFEGRPFEETFVYVRSEVHDWRAEAEAARWLDPGDDET
jgi:hypothetical protein